MGTFHEICNQIKANSNLKLDLLLNLSVNKTFFCKIYYPKYYADERFQIFWSFLLLKK
jgi:hypothetical protein